MKKLVAVLLVFFLIMGSVSLMAQAKPRLTLDLSKLTAVNLLPGDKIGDPIGGTILMNDEPFPKNYADLMVLIPEMPGVDWTAFDRVIIKVKFFREKGKSEVAQPKDGLGMVTILYDVNGDIRGGSGEGPGPNNPLKTYNLGGTSSRISTGGSPLRMTKAPGGILIQNSTSDVKFIQLMEVTFFKN
jgi:hypothetical protein